MSYCPRTGTNQFLDTPSYIGTVVPRMSGGLLIAMQDGIGIVSSLKNLSILSPPPFSSRLVRFNDGKCDPRGRLFVGSMLVDTTKSGGALWRFDNRKKFIQVLPKAWIPNGIAWSRNGTIMYWTDTMLWKVEQFDYDINTGSITNRRTCFEIPKEMGMPDGITLDVDGNLWIAHWEGYRVTKWDPFSGKLLHTVYLSTGRVSSVAFGGALLTDLYITTASFPPGHGGVIGRSNIYKRDDTLAGSLFVVRDIGKGIPAFEFDG